MATYAIGDVQGCFLTLRRMLDRLRPGPADRIWLTGDLVNRGPRSLEVLRWAAGEGERVTAVLGNHDLHLLAYAAGAAHERRGDTLREVLEARDRDDLLAWLRGRPLLHEEGGHVLVHAGLLPAWTLEEARRKAREAERLVRSGPAGPRHLPEDVAFTLLVLTRLRTCSSPRSPHPGFSGPPEEAPEGCRPWFELRGSRPETVVFGHWAALGLHRSPGYLGLDTGCVWGGRLTAARLEDGALFEEGFAG